MIFFLPGSSFSGRVGPLGTVTKIHLSGTKKTSDSPLATALTPSGQAATGQGFGGSNSLTSALVARKA